MRLQAFFALLLIAQVFSAQDGLSNFQENVLNKINALTHRVDILFSKITQVGILLIEFLRKRIGVWFTCTNLPFVYQEFIEIPFYHSLILPVFVIPESCETPYPDSVKIYLYYISSHS